MHRRRHIAGPPQRTASAAWDVLFQLVKDTLNRSQHVSVDDVRQALAPLQGLGPALVAGGHLETSPVTLVSNDLNVAITVVTGTAAFAVDENLDPVPGGANATADWALYLPSPGPLASVVAAAASQSSHLSTEVPPSTTSTSSFAAEASLLNLAALDKL